MDKLIDIVDTVEDPAEMPQDREGVTESAENLTTALAAINDPETPPQLQKELTTIVKQVTTTLEVVNVAEVPPEDRSLLLLVVKRTTATLDVICDPKTPPETRDRMIAIMKDSVYVARMTPNGAGADSPDRSQSPPGTRIPRESTVNTLLLVSSSEDIMGDRRTPAKERDRLADITHQVSALLRKASDPGTSQKERSEVAEELEKKTARMKDQQEQSASARKGAEVSLGKAAAFCTSAIFESTRESALVQGLRKLIPPKWEAEGVKDFWKAKEMNDETLDVLAQLRNNEHTHGPFEVVEIVTELAEIVPYDRLFGSLGGSALSCKQTASYLDERFGITVGTWLTRSG
ncbi:hypothetical protein ACFV2D_04360 [Streptomyces capillispiralis]|uniref:hypothetical protein n=1 Tax=Streptomyces capillispiralis TaxID=68182 RepID=UPI00369AA214